ncbi:MAG: XdhC family protein [Pseudomonadota bacterium]
MISAHRKILADVSGWLEQGKTCWLCTIIHTWGSSPRPVGSWLAVSESGDWSGSVSGGCLEEDLLHQCVQDPPESPLLVKYGITEGDRNRFQLPCGGQIHLLVEPLCPQRAVGHVRELEGALSRREAVYRQVCLTSGAQRVGICEQFHRGVETGQEKVTHYLMPECRLLLIGAGEVARHVHDFATAADFSVTLCEPRTAFAAGWGYSHIPLVRELPDDLVLAAFNDPLAGILALAHDPRVDDMGLLAALESDAFYVGAMGSVKTSRDRRERLLELGVSPARLARLNAPIGVNIPSKTPAEIAISIVADLIAARHRLRAAAPAL